MRKKRLTKNGPKAMRPMRFSSRIINMVTRYPLIVRNIHTAVHPCRNPNSDTLGI